MGVRFFRWIYRTKYKWIFDIPDPKNLQNKKKIIVLASLEQEIRKVTLVVTWPQRTRSRVIVTVWKYKFLTSVTQKKLQNKKKIIVLASLQQEIRKVTLMVTWPWRIRSRVIVAVWKYIFLTSLTLKTCKTKKRSLFLRHWNKRYERSRSWSRDLDVQGHAW